MYPDWLINSRKYNESYWDEDWETQVEGPADEYYHRMIDIENSTPDFDHILMDDELDVTVKEWEMARGKEIQEEVFASVREDLGIGRRTEVHPICTLAGVEEDDMNPDSRMRWLTRLRNVLDYPDYKYDNRFHRSELRADHQLTWSLFHKERGCSGTWPHRTPTIPQFTQLHHFYSESRMIGVPDHRHYLATEPGREQADFQSKSGKALLSVFRDARLSQVQYTASTMCHFTWLDIDHCRCLNCLLLHTACLPDIQDMDEDQILNVRVVPSLDDVQKSRSQLSVQRLGVVDPVERRPEFIVNFMDRQATPRLARDPKVYRVQQYHHFTIGRKPIPLEFTMHCDLYAELQDAEYPQVRYVIGTACRYHREDIMVCKCGICNQLRESLNMETMRCYPEDEYHYVWCSSYDVRLPHILNSRREHASLGMYPAAPDTLPEQVYDEVLTEESSDIRSTDSERSGGPTCEPAYCFITIFDCNSKFDAFKDHSGTGRVPGPFGTKDIVADSGATRHMFHDRSQFSTYGDTSNHFVRVADGTLVPVLGIGNVGPLRDVLHVPSLVYDLVSESCLDREGKWSITGDSVKTFYERTADGQPDYASVFLVARLSNTDMYIVNPMYLGMANDKYNYKCYDVLASKTEAIDLLHKVLGHISIDRIQDLVKSGHVIWNHESPPVNLRKYSSPCVACALAKSKRKAHTGRITTPITAGSLIYVDVWGPCDTVSLLNENVYTIGFIDAATKKAWLYQRKKKSDILDCLKHFYETVIVKRRASHGLQEFVVQSDNGEFKSDAILKIYTVLVVKDVRVVRTHLRSWRSLNGYGVS